MKNILYTVILLLTISNICLLKHSFALRERLNELEGINTSNKRSMLKMAKNQYKAYCILQADSTQKRLINY